MLKKRIITLVEGGVIVKEVGDFVCDVIDFLEEYYPKADVTGAEMFTTHLAMATQRVKDGEALEGLDSETWAGITTSGAYEEALKVYEELFSETIVTYPEGEKRFLIVHLCNIIDNQQREESKC